MEDRAEMAVHKHAITQEGLQTQAKIIGNLFRGESLHKDTAQTTLEGYYRNFIAQHASRARKELQTSMGISTDKTTPAIEGQEIILDPEETEKVIKYFLDVFGLHEDHTPINSKENIDNVLNLKKSLQVHLIGPILQVRFRTDDAYRLLNKRFPKSKGAFFPLPLPQAEQDQEIKISKNVYVNFVSEEGEAMEGQNAHQHELWHAIDHFRYEEYQKIKKSLQDKDSQSIKSNQNQAFEQSEEKSQYRQASKFKERLDRYFFDTQDFVTSLSKLKATAPEIYNFYVHLDPDKTQTLNGEKDKQENEVVSAFERSFFSVQSELPAFIAGFLNGDDSSPITDNRGHDIIDGLVYHYMPFDAVDFENLYEIAKEDNSGKWTVDETKIDTAFNYPVTAAENTADLQQIIDFFLNPGGKGYEVIERSKTNIAKSIEAYQRLAKHRDNPYQALVELSLLPISHWGIYTQRKLSS